MFCNLGTILLFTLVAGPLSQDPVVSDGDNYTVIMENEKVRVLDYKDKPGEKTSMHSHPNFVLYALSPFNRKLTLGNGNVIIREFKTGDVLWSPAQMHIGENIGTTDTHVVIVELKDSEQYMEKETEGSPGVDAKGH